MPKKCKLPLEIIDLIVSFMPPFVSIKLSIKYFRIYKKWVTHKRCDEFKSLWGYTRSPKAIGLTDFSTLPLVSNFINLEQGITITVCIEHLDSIDKIDGTHYLSVLKDYSRDFYAEYYTYKPVEVAVYQLTVATKLSKSITVRCCARYSKRQFDEKTLSLFNDLTGLSYYLHNIKPVNISFW